VVTKTGCGTFVSEPKLRSRDAGDINALTERIDTVIARGLNLGMEAGDLTEMFEQRLGKFIKKSKGGRKNE
jgi:hypothetical protein